jgi:heat shock protein HspQ
VIRILEEIQSEDNPDKFKTGHIITHKRYGYRGVIVHIDPNFQGNENWYLSNQAQPSKEQPWYFVLVDRNQQVTYVADENLKHDNSHNLVVHPMLNLFFYNYDAELKRYTRNDVPWNPGAPPDAPPPLPLPPPNFKPTNPPAL